MNLIDVIIQNIENVWFWSSLLAVGSILVVVHFVDGNVEFMQLSF